MSVLNEDVVLKAETFAYAAHRAISHARKYDGGPYWKHPFAVASRVAEVADISAEAVAAAYLHDTVEDTGITIADILFTFGPHVTEYVIALTDPDRPDKNRATRKAEDCIRLGLADAEVHTIKVADMLDNAASIMKEDPKFAKQFMKEKEELLSHLTKADPTLLSEAHRVIREYKDTKGE
jgi:(p)ppGpp synthase/HD superfamily hydrolase